jgi:subtilisin-like proprotein convertase family protein
MSALRLRKPSPSRAGVSPHSGVEEVTMRPESTEDRSRVGRVRSRFGRQIESARSRKLSRRQSALEYLEPKILLATLPPAQVQSQAIVSGSRGHESSPSIAVHPTNPDKMVAVWTRNDTLLTGATTVVAEGSYSINGGQSWINISAANNVSPPQRDPAIATPVQNFAQITDASVAFDRYDNFYVLTSQHSVAAANGVTNSGALVLTKFNFSGNAPSRTDTNIIHRWTNDAVITPTLAVDDTVGYNPATGLTQTFTDPLTEQEQASPYSGNVYVAWASNDVKPDQLPADQFNPNRIMMIASSDGGQTFSGKTAINDGAANGSRGFQRNAMPRLAISQGTADGSIVGGQVTVVWDDFNSDQGATPRRDIIKSDRIQNGAVVDSFTAGPVDIIDAVTVDGNTVPGVTLVPLNVNITDPRFTTLRDVNVSLTMLHPNRDQLTVRLVEQVTGRSVTLFTPGTFTGGGDIGRLNGVDIGTIFTDIAARNIFDANAAGNNTITAPAIGHYQPRGAASLNSPTSGFGGLTLAQINNGNWFLEITDSTPNTNPVQRLDRVTVTFTSGLTPGSDVEVARTYLRGGLNGVGQSNPAPGVNPKGLAPSPVIASDNTLGSFSVYQGRLYVAFVDRAVNDPNRGLIVNNANPADNTDIHLAVSTNGGQSWSRVHGYYNPVNDDRGSIDGFSEGLYDTTNNQIDGRPQFLPAIAVDQSTGTLVMSWYDARHDAARARVTTYMTTSIDGGSTFAPGVYVNPDRTAIDAATNQVITLGPLPDNQSSAIPGAVRDTTFGFGTRIGIAAAGGRVVPVWSSNRNFAGTNNAGDDGQRLLEIASAVVNIGAGPRIVNSTMGPQANFFEVLFDRRVDPLSFTPSDVRVFFRDTSLENTTGRELSVLSVTPLDDNVFGATVFRVEFELLPADISPVGTYSYQVGPIISDRIRTANASGVLVSPGNLMDQNANGTTGQQAQNGVGPGDVYAVPRPTALGAPFTILADGAFDAPFDPATLPMILSGPRLVGTALPGVPGGGTLAVDRRVDAIDLTFDRPMQVGTFTTGDILSLIGPTGPYNGQLQVRPVYRQNVAMSIPDNAATPAVSLLEINSPGFTIADLDLRLDISHPRASELRIVLIAPDGTRITLVENLTATGANFRGTTFDDQAATSILDTPAPFTGRFQPVEDLSALIGKDLSGTWRLEVTDTVSGNQDPLLPSPTINSWSLTAVPETITPTILADAFRVELLAPTSTSDALVANLQAISGTYELRLGPQILSAFGEPLDQNRNAGLALLRRDPEQAVTFRTPTSPSQAIPASGSIEVPINVSEAFLVQGLTLQMSVNHPNVRELTGELILPDGQTITLFSPDSINVTGSNFTGTTFDDNAATPIEEAGPPFFGRFQPEAGNSLGTAVGSQSIGEYRLRITNNSTNTGTLNGWSLQFLRDLPSGLGELVADQARTTFRVFTMDATDEVAANNWTPVGPASIVGPDVLTGAGRVSAIAVDPSDPTGNTVYVGGASGGVWRTTNFLNPGGPTYVPLTDFGPHLSLNVGAITVIGRNNDPDQSIIFVGTGEPNVTGGVGFLRSMDGGRTWDLNSGPGNAFINNSVFDVVADPTPTLGTTDNFIVYAAMGGPNGGFYRSQDTGNTWQLLQAGTATDIQLDAFSADPVSGNFNRVYVGIQGQGVFRSEFRGENLQPMPGGIGKPLVQSSPNNPIPVAGTADVAPPSTNRIVLAQPTPTGELREDLYYQDWLYAAVGTGGGATFYMTKDRGENWTQIQIPNTALGVPSNNDNLANAGLNLTNTAITLANDPNDPNVVYLGGASGRLLRLDVSQVYDPHALLTNVPDRADGGLMRPGTNTLASSPAVLGNDNDNFFGNSPIISQAPNQTLRYSTGQDVINLTRNPRNPQQANATFFITNVSTFSNAGVDVRWTPYDSMLQFSNGLNTLVTINDPITGRARLLVGTNHGVYTAADNGTTPGAGSIGSAIGAFGTRNGNLQLAQIHFGAVQPSEESAAIAGALFHAMTLQNGFPDSSANILETGNITWTDFDLFPDNPLINVASVRGSGSGVATAQVATPGTQGDLYQFKWPNAGGRNTDFFQVDDVGRTTGLFAFPGDGANQWPNGRSIAPGIVTGNFAVNPINNDQLLISSNAGRLFISSNQGLTWNSIGTPAQLGNSYGSALAFGAPEPGVVNPGNFDRFIYVGTESGRVFISQDRGGNWTEVSGGLDGSPILKIIPRPDRDSREAYAVTRNGVYRIANSTAAGATWQNITGNLFQVQRTSLVQGVPSQPILRSGNLHSIATDWRYRIPLPGGGDTPMLYAAGEGGVLRSIDGGVTWTSFPDNIATGAPGVGTPADYGYLPNVRVTDLDMSLGNINPDNGRPIESGGFNILVASTYGRGQFAIRLAPEVLSQTVGLSATLPPPDGSDSGLTPESRQDLITNVTQPVFEGLSSISGFGNTVRITLFDLTDPVAPVIIGGYDPENPMATEIPANFTNDLGQFAVQVYPGVFADDGSTDGVKVIGIQATNDAGARGNMVEFTFELDTTRPDAPEAPDLQAASDTGTYDDDNITFDTSPTFDVFVIEENATVVLFRDANDGLGPVEVARILETGGGTIAITDPGPVPEGTYIYTAQQIDLAGNVSIMSAGLEVVIDLTPPDPLTVFALQEASHTGTYLDDGVTMMTTLVFDVGIVEERATVLLFRDGQEVARLEDTVGGPLTITDQGPVPDGTYIYTAQQIDLAGNEGPVTEGLTITVDTIPPVAPAQPDLQAASDTGTFPDDNITNLTVLTFDVAGIEDRATVRLFRNGVLVAELVDTAGGTVAITDPGPVPEGTHIYTAQQVDLAGNESPISVGLEVIVDLSDPAVPLAPDLQAASDSGLFDNDNVTNVTSPTFDVFGIEPTAEVLLFRDDGNGPVLVARLLDTPGGTVAITDPGPVPDGVYIYTAQQVNRAGNESPISAGLTVIIDTIPPNRPSTPLLLPADDSGVPNDNITNVTRPRVFGTIALTSLEALPEFANPFVQIINTQGVVLGIGQADNAGNYVVQVDNPLPEGIHVLRTRSIDLAGNIGPISDATLVIDVRTTPPPPISINLDPRDDSGVFGDNITFVTQPRLFGATGPDLTVQIIDVNGNLTGTPNTQVGASVLSQSDGAYTFQFATPLPDGVYTFVARAVDIAANTTDSPPLVLEIDTIPPENIPDLRLDPASDTGARGNNRTSERRPFLIGTTDPNSFVEIIGPTGEIVADGVADAEGNFRLQLASNLVNGTIALRARARDVAGNQGTPSDPPLVLTIETTPGDYDADGVADLALFRPDPATNTARWFLDRSTLGAMPADFGRPGDIPIQGDFDGDGIIDIGVYRPFSDRQAGSAEWLILGSRMGFRSILFGSSGLDLPAPADFDGDGITDLAVYRPQSDLVPGASQWFILLSAGGAISPLFGGAGLDIPVPADYDGDGRADLAVFRPSSDLVPGAAQWFIARTTDGPIAPVFGQANLDVPVPADYDGDGRTDIAVFRPTTAQWFYLGTQAGATQVQFGNPDDIPVPGDYDGDGRADLTVFRQTTGQWFIRGTATGDRIVNFGSPGDIPAASPLAYRLGTPGNVVAPPAFIFGNRTAEPAASQPLSQGSTAQSLNFGAQAARLSSATLGTSTTLSDSGSEQTNGIPASRNLVAQGQSEEQGGASNNSPINNNRPASRRSLLDDFLKRRARLRG